jgi:hypothetical protein
MKRLLSLTIFGACLLATSQAVSAQNCTNLTDYDLRGTYTMSGSGWVNLATLLPSVQGLPNQLIPMSWLGAYTANGAGGVTGWVSFNGGGSQMTASFVGTKYSVKSDCSIQASLSMKINELPNVAPVVFTRLMVPVVKQDGAWWMAPALEIHVIWQGNAPGAPAAAAVDLAVAHRISLQF